MQKKKKRRKNIFIRNRYIKYFKEKKRERIYRKPLHLTSISLEHISMFAKGNVSSTKQTGNPFPLSQRVSVRTITKSFSHDSS